MNRKEYEKRFASYDPPAPTTRITSIEKTDDNIYLNIVMDHPEFSIIPSIGPPTNPNFYITGETPIDCSYNVTKTEPILSRCSDYYCSVVRFVIPLDEVPISICPIVPNQGPSGGNPNITPMILGISYLTDFSVNVLYTAQNTLNPPKQNQTLQVITPYYFMYSYDNLIKMFNTALAMVWNSSGLDALFPTYLPPYFFLDYSTNLISLVVPKCFVELTSPAVAIPTIFMNSVCQNYLDAFDFTIFGYDSPVGKDVVVQLTDKTRPENFYYPNGVTIPTPVDPTTGLPARPFYYKVTQQYSVLEYWTSLRKIIITTNTIPVRNEYIPTVNNLSNITNIDTNGINNSLPIISDFVPNIDSSAGSSRSIAYYTPSAQYRLTDLLSDGPLQNIDIRILWQDKEGNLYPLKISVLQQASMKILFTKKTLYRNDTDGIKNIF